MASQPSRTSAPDCLHRADERPLDLGAGGVAARVHDARRPSGRPRARARAAAVDDRSKCAPSAMSSRHACRALAREHADRVGVAEPAARGERVGACSSGESSSSTSAAATPPCA